MVSLVCAKVIILSTTHCSQLIIMDLSDLVHNLVLLFLMLFVAIADFLRCCQKWGAHALTLVTF